MNNEILIQVTSGRGPTECCWVVSQVLKTMLKEAGEKDINCKIIQQKKATEPDTLVSALIKLWGPEADTFAKTWEGCVLWIGQSNYRKYHKRKNWFVNVKRINQEVLFEWNETDIMFQTLRASGPGGQHVNKTESAVRAIHSPSGLQVTASNQRSQLQNKKLAKERLQEKLAQWQWIELSKNEQSRWHQHNTLERGNPVRVFRGSEFVAGIFQMACFMYLLI
jgi:peptide chain release factor